MNPNTLVQRAVRLAALLAALAVAAWAVAGRDEGIAMRTMPYGPHAMHLADVYEANSGASPAKPRPAALMIHGGGWSAGTRADFADLARWIARQGFVAVSVDYRLVPSARWPAQADDVELAMWWLRENAATLRIDPRRVVVVGGSAGGHLAGWLATSDRRSPLGTPSRADAVISFWGPWDLSVSGLREDARNMIAALVGPQAPREASPIFRVDARTAPTMFIHGTADELVPHDQSTRACAALIAARVRCELLLLEGAEHGLTRRTAEPAKVLQRMQAFIAEVLPERAAP